MALKFNTQAQFLLDTEKKKIWLSAQWKMFYIKVLYQLRKSYGVLYQSFVWRNDSICWEIRILSIPSRQSLSCLDNFKTTTVNIVDHLWDPKFKKTFHRIRIHSSSLIYISNKPNPSIDLQVFLKKIRIVNTTESIFPYM